MLVCLEQNKLCLVPSSPDGTLGVIAVILHYCHILDRAQWFIPSPQCFWRLFPSRWKHSWPCCSRPLGPLWAPNLAKGLACTQLCAQRSGSTFWFEPADLGHHYFSTLPPSLLVLPSHWGLSDLAIGPLWPSKQGNALAQPLVCKMDWNTEFALYLQSPRTIKTPQRGIVFLHFCYSVGWNPQSSELCADWHLRTRPGLVPHVHTGHRCCFGQLGGPWDHLPPLFGLPVCTIMFTDQLLFLIALDKAPKPHSPRAMRGDKEMPQSLSLPMALSFWCPEPRFPSALQHCPRGARTDFSIPRDLPQSQAQDQNLLQFCPRHLKGWWNRLVECAWIRISLQVLL